MGMSLNRVQLIGNLTRDPEIKQIPGGTTVATFGVATNFNWTDQSGAKQSRAEFHNVVAWRKLAEICGQFLRKGSKVFVEGRLQTRDWEAEDGTKRYRTEIVADNMIMLDRKGDFEGGSDASRSGSSSSGSSSSGSYSDREPAGIKNTGDVMTKEKEVAPVSAEAPTGGDVSIDDLPF